MLLDSDDMLDSEATAKLVRAWTPETGALFYRLSVVNVNGIEIGKYLPDLSFTMSSGDVIPHMLNHGGRYRLPPTSGMSFSRRIFEAATPIPEKDYPQCADSYLRVVVPFLTPISILDEPLAYYRVHSSNDQGWAIPRRFITCKLIEYRKYYRDKNFALFKKIATSHDMVIPASSSPCRAEDLFEELLLDRSRTKRLSLLGRLKQARSILSQMPADGVSGASRVRQAVVLLFVCLAPRVFLSLIFPNLFSK